MKAVLIIIWATIGGLGTTGLQTEKTEIVFTEYMSLGGKVITPLMDCEQVKEKLDVDHAPLLPKSGFTALTWMVYAQCVQY